ncbi:DUF1292 domain-containing protein [Bacillus alkalicellulosilyticus]|uniref:DUF1292 domain-containing protein n=1 Tax=Alkalihalobacterium alkalicellulosilyticum TaxID=1912214 RepID=UPI000998B918|nr:DUF1292 domain-containing protein [Bacillus alkalicellulosilyticus]
MEENNRRDQITIEDENGMERQYSIEALFDMENQSYALLSGNDETLVMRLEEEQGKQYLVGISDPEERDAILSAYEIAIEADNENMLH